MPDQMALKIAIDLMHVPSQVRLFRVKPLPDGVVVLLRIAAGDAEAEQSAVDATGRSQPIIRDAATFFIEQILFAPENDSYRVLGSNSKASAGELRRNLALLLSWLHPDKDPKGERSVFIGRVTAAWNNLKTPERRAAYDELQKTADARRKSRGKNARPQFGRYGSPYQRGAGKPGKYINAPPSGSLLRRALAALFQRAWN